VSAASAQLLLRPDTTVTCPKCADEFSLDQGFAKKALEQLAETSAHAIAAVRDAERAQVEKRAEQLALERARAAQDEAAGLKKLLKEQSDAHAKALADVRALAEQSVAPRIEEMQKALNERDSEVKALRGREEALAAREKELESRVHAAALAKTAEMLAAERKSFEEQLADKNAQVATLRNEQLQLRKEREQLKDERAAMELTVQKKADELVQQREIIVRTQEQERSSLKEAELQKTIADMRAQLVEAQRKADQGSQQMQGEVLELALEEGLKRAFPFDLIEEVKKGVRGGDVIQRVLTRTGEPAAVLLWETKRARDWSPQWHAKLREDMRGCGAEVGILVTIPTAVPKEWLPGQVFGPVDGVWIVVWSVALQLAEALRTGALDVHKQRLVSAGKGEKMEAVYDYVTSAQFAQKIRAVYDTFGKMRQELESEKAQATQRWARREKMLEQGKAQLLGIGGEIQGLAQQELPQLEMESDELELP
jgi:hypothetical protein